MIFIYNCSYFVDTNEDEMPGLPIEPEIVSEITTEALSEVSPVTVETLPDMESPVPADDSRTLEETEYEAVEEVLHEVEPPEEDHMEDFEVSGLEVVKDSDLESDDENSDDSEDESVSDTGDTVTNIVDDEADHQTDEFGTSINEEAISRLQGEIDTDKTEHDSSNKIRESEDIFHDAVDGRDTNTDKANIGEDPGGETDTPVQTDPDNSCDVDTTTLSKHSEIESDIDNKKHVEDTVTKDESESIVDVVENNNVETHSDGNVDCNTDLSVISEGDISETNKETSVDIKDEVTDGTVTSLTDTKAEQV